MTRIWIFFPENCGEVSNEHGERFHQDFLQWRRDMKGNRTVLCSPTTADFGNGCPYHGIQATGKTGKKKNYKILFVLNNELTLKRLCRCSVYIVNGIPKQNNSTKHILFH